jgi:hypothetical protein
VISSVGSFPFFSSQGILAAAQSYRHPDISGAAAAYQVLVVFCFPNHGFARCQGHGRPAWLACSCPLIATGSWEIVSTLAEAGGARGSSMSFILIFFQPIMGDACAIHSSRFTKYEVNRDVRLHASPFTL